MDGSPICSSHGTSCDSGTLLFGRGNVKGGSERNQPNTRDGDKCDGSSGNYQSDKSLERLMVRSVDGGMMMEGSTNEIVASVWAWSDGSEDYLDLYYSDSGDLSNPNWVYIGTYQSTGGSEQTIVIEFDLPSGLNHFNGGNYRWRGSPSPCTAGYWADADDLVFTVNPLTVNTKSPTVSPVMPPSKIPSNQPSTLPSAEQSLEPNSTPTSNPLISPSGLPSKSFIPSFDPSNLPSLELSTSASLIPSSIPLFAPTLKLTTTPRVRSLV